VRVLNWTVRVMYGNNSADCGSHHRYTEVLGERVYVRAKWGMKGPDRERTRVGNKMCAKGSRERGDERRGRRQRYSSRLWMHMTAARAPLRLSPRGTRPGLSLYRHFRCAASGFSGSSESPSTSSTPPTFSEPPKPSPVTPCLVCGCGLLSVSPAGVPCRFDRGERVREGSVSP
jgi:hypothetical protein